MITGKNLVAGNWEHSKRQQFLNCKSKYKKRLTTQFQEATLVQIADALTSFS